MNFLKQLHPEDNEALFSSCKLYRWALKRNIQSVNRTLLFIGLNPSKGNSYYDDPTIKRLRQFCLIFGYGNLIILNLFARVTKSPKLLRTCFDPIGEENDKVLDYNALTWSKNSLWDLCFGWGRNGGLFKRDFEVMRLLSPHFVNRSIFCKGSLGPLAFGLNTSGSPRHPLYLPSTSKLKPYDWKNFFLQQSHL